MRAKVLMLGEKRQSKPRRPTFSMGLRLPLELVEALDSFNQLKFHGTRTRSSLITEAIVALLKRDYPDWFGQK